jgi:hypothetical protein
MRETDMAFLILLLFKHIPSGWRRYFQTLYIRSEEVFSDIIHQKRDGIFRERIFRHNNGRHYIGRDEVFSDIPSEERRYFHSLHQKRKNVFQTLH